MEDTRFFGYFKSDDKIRCKALGEAITTVAADFQYDQINHPEYDLDISEESLLVFPPVQENRSLSGLWSSLYPNHQQGDADFAEPNCIWMQTEWGIIFSSNRGSFEVVSQIICHVANEDDEATLWWELSDLAPDSRAGTIVLRDGEFHVESEPSKAFLTENVLSRVERDRQKMFNLLFALTPAMSGHNAYWRGMTTKGRA